MRINLERPAQFRKVRTCLVKHWGMVIDLRKCVGCEVCTLVCKTNLIAPGIRKIMDLGLTGAPERMRTFVPVSCMNCAKAPCVKACPTRASYKREDGIVDIKKELCLGCGYCVLSCPYKARKLASDLTEIARLNGKKGNSTEGSSAKCNFCAPRIDSGLKKRMKPGVHPEATPLCVLACSASALSFGDLNDEESNVSVLLKTNRSLRLQEELGTMPSVFYIVDDICEERSE